MIGKVFFNMYKYVNYVTDKYKKNSCNLCFYYYSF